MQGLVVAASSRWRNDFPTSRINDRWGTLSHVGCSPDGDGSHLQDKSEHPTSLANLRSNLLQETVEQETDLSNIRKAPIQNFAQQDRQHARTRDAAPPETCAADPEEFQNGAFKNSAALAPSGAACSSYGPERQIIVDYIVDFAREFNDAAPAKSSVTRAVNLFYRSGLALDDFCEKLYAARAVVKERTAAITTTTMEPGMRFPTKRKMGYFFAVLEDQLGLKAG